MKKCLAAEQVKFFLTRQANQTYGEFLNELKEKARSCEFENYRTADSLSWLNQALFVAFVAGIEDADVRRTLLTTDDLDVEKALSIDQTCEVIDEQEKAHSKGKKRRSDVESDDDSEEDGKKACRVCGRNNHHWQFCWFRTANCDNCGIRGHTAAGCKAKKAKKPRRKY